MEKLLKLKESRVMDTERTNCRSVLLKAFSVVQMQVQGLQMVVNGNFSLKPRRYSRVRSIINKRLISDCSC